MDRATISHILKTVGKPSQSSITRTRWFEERDHEWKAYTNSDMYIKAKEALLLEKRKAQEKLQRETRQKQKEKSSCPVITSSKICKASLKNQRCRRNGNCSFAHTSEEFFPNKCRFDSRCKFRHSTCYFIHSGETKAKMIKRLVDSQNNKH